MMTDSAIFSDDAGDIDDNSDDVPPLSKRVRTFKKIVKTRNNHPLSEESYARPEEICSQRMETSEEWGPIDKPLNEFTFPSQDLPDIHPPKSKSSRGLDRLQKSQLENSDGSDFDDYVHLSYVLEKNDADDPILSYSEAMQSVGSAASIAAKRSALEEYKQLDKQPALIPEEEYIVEHGDWLINDMPQSHPRKRQRLDTLRHHTLNLDLLRPGRRPTSGTLRKRQRQTKITAYTADEEEMGDMNVSDTADDEEMRDTENIINIETAAVHLNDEQTNMPAVRVRVKVIEKIFLIPLQRQEFGKYF